MNNWTQLFGVVLILGHLCISMSAAHIERTRGFDDGRSIRTSQSLGPPKTRRMMMGLGAEMGWGFGQSGFKFPHVKRGTLFRRATEPSPAAPNHEELKADAPSGSAASTSAPDSGIVLKDNSGSEGQGASDAGSSASKAASFSDSVIVLRNQKRSEGELATGAPNHSNLKSDAASKSGLIPDSVIVLRNHKRSETQGASSAGSSAPSPAFVSDSEIVLRNHKRSDASNHPNLTPDAASKSASLSNSVIVLRNHKRSEGKPENGAGSSATMPVPVSDSVIVLRNHKRSAGQLASGAGSERGASKSTFYDDSVIVLRNHRRSEEEESLSQVDRREPEIVLKNDKRSAGNTSSGSSFRDSTIVDLSQNRISQPKMAMGMPISRRSLRHSSRVPDSSPESTLYPAPDSVILPRDVPLSDLPTVSEPVTSV